MKPKFLFLRLRINGIIKVGIGIPIIVSKKLRNRKIEKIIQMNFRVDKVDNKE